MKKIALATLLSLGVATSATANTKFFIQGDLGYYNSSDFDSGFLWRPTIGLEMDNHILALEPYTPIADQDIFGYEADAFAVGVKYAYRFDINSMIKPYIGGRLTYNHLKFKNSAETWKYTASDFGIGVLGGFEFPLTPHFSVGANVEYNWVNSSLFDMDTFGVTGFAKYTF